MEKEKKDPKRLPLISKILHKNEKARKAAISFFWFIIGFSLTALFLVSFVLIVMEYLYKDKAYKGIYIDQIYVGDKSKEEIKELFDKKNQGIKNTSLIFSLEEKVSTLSASQLSLGYDSNLIAEQAYGLGRSYNIFTDLYFIITSSLYGFTLPASYTFSAQTLESTLDPIQNEVRTEPEDALFSVQNGKVVAFRQSSEGKTIDLEVLHKKIEDIIPKLFEEKKDEITFKIPIKVLEPNITTERANSLGIVEQIGEGKSYFKGSILNRIHNITLASSRMNGILIPPSQVFSFNDNLGDVSKYTGYKEAYVIKQGKTVLGDGGGVCQVSTTLFRAVLSAGLEILERHAHAYRVFYYEQNSKVGFDATVYAPSADFKFKNDTQNYILIQTVVNLDEPSLTFVLYGKKDGREVEMTQPVVTNQTPPPPPLYQDDPNLPKDKIQQTEHEAWGANVYFTQTVKMDGQVVRKNTFTSHYTPWQAVFLKGTKE